MKCITQIPVIPIETAAKSNHRILVAPVLARALLVQRSPRNEPRKDIR
jgi:hypothetical protein